MTLVIKKKKLKLNSQILKKVLPLTNVGVLKLIKFTYQEQHPRSPS